MAVILEIATGEEQRSATLSPYAATAEERAELLGDIERIFVRPEHWLDTPHPELANHKPREFLQPGNERPLIDLIAAIKYGVWG